MVRDLKIQIRASQKLFKKHHSRSTLESQHKESIPISIHDKYHKVLQIKLFLLLSLLPTNFLCPQYFLLIFTKGKANFIMTHLCLTAVSREKVKIEKLVKVGYLPTKN